MPASYYRNTVAADQLLSWMNTWPDWVLSNLTAIFFLCLILWSIRCLEKR